MSRNIRDRNDVIAFQRAADQFCRLLEHSPTDAQRWVEETLAAVALLYATAHPIPDLDLPDDAAAVPEEFEVSDEEWRRIYDCVHGILGDQSDYWAHFDPSEPNEPDEPVRGDLCDDLTDIYRDVKPGLRAWDAGDHKHLPRIVFNWKETMFGSHWGVHAVSAMRALHPIAFLRGLDQGSL